MLSAAELSHIKQLYPGLNLVPKEGKYYIEGGLRFCACYDKESDELAIMPVCTARKSGNFIEDYYKIEIELLSDFPKSFPVVRETGGRTCQIMEKHSIKDICNLHVNKNQNNALCLCPKPAERLWFPSDVDIIHFINHLVVPFFYGLSYYDRYEKWPWNEYSHGDLGIFEFYAENADKQDNVLAMSCFESLREQGKELIRAKKVIKGHLPCICGSGEKIRNCHGLALQGIGALKAILKLNIV